MLFRRKSPHKKSAGDPAVPEAAPEHEDALFERILLVVDGSKASTAAARYAVQLAVESGGALTAAYVVDTATMDYLTQMHIFIQAEREEFEKDLERTGNRYLDYVGTLAANRGISVTKELRKGSFHKTILRLAAELPASVLVLGGWRHTITRKDTASVERRLILDEAECPVLIVKAPPEPRD